MCKISQNFAHLHVHSEYSLLDGLAKINELVTQAKNLNMTSLALTDHGTMYGIIDFYKAAKSVGIKPILGCEVYVSTGSRFEKATTEGRAYYHLVLLAKNNDGYKNLVKLVSLGFTEGFYYKPRVDLELLQKYHNGIIALSACLAGVIARPLLDGQILSTMEKQALVYENIFGHGNFFLELQNHGIAEQTQINEKLISIHKNTNIPLVATNDVHYINRADHKAHDILLCIQTNKTVHEPNRLRYHGDQFYLKSSQEMYELLESTEHKAEMQAALENTQKIADKCNVEIEFNNYKLPKYPLPTEISPFEYLAELCKNGLTFRYENNANLHIERLNFELETIQNMGFVDYFLVVWDFIKYAKDNGIAVGPGRGSAAGSLVAYCLQITDVDPIKYGLMFERFLNPERISMPDIDIDFCYERRPEVIKYVVDKYGKDFVAQIITFGTLAAKAVIRDVGRALDIPYSTVDKIAKLIPQELGITIQRAMEVNLELNNKEYAELLEMSQRLEGLPRHASTHAAGVVICDEPVGNHVPLYQADGFATTQFTMNTLEELGLLKMDFLGLRTLTVINNAIQEIQRGHKITIDWNKIGYEDSAVYKLISQGQTEGIFQLESSGMKAFIKELQPENLEDIIAGISLFRPGPMDFIPKYVRGKHSKQPIMYTHPALEPILSATYGCIVYQEQVMQIVRELAGYSLAHSDLVRRAMSKKKGDVMAQEREHFIKGCAERNIDENSANKIFDEMSDFAKYAFNKSHAAAYAVIGYQTAWLKCHYPVEFMAASMTSVMESKVVEYILACKKMKIRLLQPDINEGFAHFSVSNGTIRFGLVSIKNVGRGAIEAIVAERTANGKYTSLTNFIQRVTKNGENINSRCIEGLINSGAFDSLGGKRSQYLAVYKTILDAVAQSRKNTFDGQLNLFGENFSTTIEDADNLPNIPELDETTLLTNEKEAIGLYISGHPLKYYENFLAKTTASVTIKNAGVQDNQKLFYGGIITKRTVHYTRNGHKPMAFLTIEDFYDNIEVVVFSQLYEKYSLRLSEDSVIIIEGTVSLQEEEVKIIANNIFFYEEPPKSTFWIKIPTAHNLPKVSKLLQNYPGSTLVKIYNEENQQKLVYEKKVNPSPNLIASLENLLGENTVKLVNIKEN
ncbi:MAG: DNA polymerase III subunit alpha [Firmicutes bacterium]|nr:DNA polymerase III subunit alpha [Bacillota bacterium]